MEDQTPQQPREQPELHKILRQLKILNFWIAFFGVSILITMAIFGFLAFKLVTFVQNTNNQLTTLQKNTTETLDVKSQLCSSSLLKDSAACKSE
jgi:hypothetical protein